MNKQEALQKLKKEILKTQIAYLDHPIGFGWGNVDAEIFFVGQNPGYWPLNTLPEEIIPFALDIEELGTGAGYVFKRMLRELKIRRDKIYVSNVVYFSGDIKQISQDMIQLHMNFLKKEIEIVDPKVIVCLGALARQVFNVGLGEVKQVNHYIVLGTEHPSYIWRFFSEENFRRFVNMIKLIIPYLSKETFYE